MDCRFAAHPVIQWNVDSVFQFPTLFLIEIEENCGYWTNRCQSARPQLCQELTRPTREKK